MNSVMKRGRAEGREKFCRSAVQKTKLLDAFPYPFSDPRQKVSAKQGLGASCYERRASFSAFSFSVETLLLSRRPVPTALYCPRRFLLQILSLSRTHQGTHGQFDSVAGLGLNVVKMLSDFLIITFNNQCQLVFRRFFPLTLPAGSTQRNLKLEWLGK